MTPPSEFADEEETRERFRLLDERVDSLEKMFAQLFMGYAEINAAIEALLWQLFGGTDSEASTEYRDKFEKTRAGLIGWLNDASKQMGISADGLDAHLLRMVSEDPAFGQKPPRAGDLPDEPVGSDSE